DHGQGYGYGKGYDYGYGCGPSRHRILKTCRPSAPCRSADTFLQQRPSICITRLIYSIFAAVVTSEIYTGDYDDICQLRQHINLRSSYQFDKEMSPELPDAFLRRCVFHYIAFLADSPDHQIEADPWGYLDFNIVSQSE
ncbi:MAG: hypothetical protein NTZ90_00615, partial [Proteobacteria bacterium]|nr:hypothetical protein [Pseudomonadota bacterium]